MGVGVPLRRVTPTPQGQLQASRGPLPVHVCPWPSPGLTLCPSLAQVLLLEAAERPASPGNALPVPQSTPPPWNEDFLPDAIPLAHPGPRRRPTGPAGECGSQGGPASRGGAHMASQGVHK